MRKGRRAAGALLLVGAIVLAIVALTVQFPEGTHSAAAPWTVTSSSALTVSATLSWKGATTSTHVYVTHGDATCSTLTSVVAQGSGASGAVAFRLVPGSAYAIFGCNDPSASSTEFTLLAAGAQGYGLLLAVAAGLLAIAGAALLFGATGARRSRPAYPRRRREFD